MAQNFPGKHFDILFDVPGFRGREAHDNLEKVLTVDLGLRNGERAEALKIPPNSIFLLDCKADSNQRLEQVDGIHTCNKAFFLPIPVDATDANTIGCPILRGDRSEVSVDSTTILHPREVDEAAFRITFLSGPVFSHRVQVAVEFQNRF